MYVAGKTWPDTDQITGLPMFEGVTVRVLAGGKDGSARLLLHRDVIDVPGYTLGTYREPVVIPPAQETVWRLVAVWSKDANCWMAVRPGANVVIIRASMDADLNVVQTELARIQQLTIVTE